MLFALRINYSKLETTMYTLLRQAITDGLHVGFTYDGKRRTVYPLEVKSKGQNSRLVLYGYERSSTIFRSSDQLKSFALDKIHSLHLLPHAA